MKGRTQIWATRLGTERMRTSYTGAVEATYYSLPWGDGYSPTVNDSWADVDILHFAGLDQDNAASGMPMSEHAQYRNYSSAQGRWLSPDPYDGSYDLTNPQSLNRYAYVLNNPLSFLDPSGQNLVLQCDENGQNCVEYDDGNGPGDAGGSNCNVPWGDACATGDGAGPGTWPCQEYGLCGTNPSYSTPIPQNPPTAPSKPGVGTCLAQAASNGRGVALALDAVGDIATAVAVANPASASAIIVASAASSLGGLNALAHFNSPSFSWSGYGVSLGTLTVNGTGALTSSLEIGGLIQAGTSFAKGLTHAGVLGSLLSTVGDASAAISAYTSCRNGQS
jgi:RHS repeat-associated protein